MSDSKDILYEKKDRVGIITINRPEVRNAMTYGMRDELRDLFAEIKEDPDVGAVILTGAGDKAFIAGADIAELRHDNPVLERKEIMMRAHRVFRAMEKLRRICRHLEES